MKEKFCSGMMATKLGRREPYEKHSVTCKAVDMMLDTVDARFGAHSTFYCYPANAARLGGWKAHISQTKISFYDLKRFQGFPT